MNGTLISHPPGGGGSGSSVTNGGPACMETVVKQQVRRTRTRRMFTTMLLARDRLSLRNSHLALGHYLWVTFRIRPSAGSIRYAVSSFAATTPRAPLTVGTNAFRWNF